MKVVTPAVGQVWADNDKRTGHGRMLKIVELRHGGNDTICIMENVVSKLRTRVNARRLRPTSNGYRLAVSL